MSENNQDVTMGNQQAKTHFNVGWLVGIVEGEGCITLTRGAVTKGKYGHKISPYLSIVNTNKALIDKTVEVIEFFNLPFHLSTRKYDDGGEGKNRYALTVTGLKRTKQWLQFLLPYMVGKKKQTEIALEFINQREKVIDKHPWNKPYTDIDLELYKEIHNYNARPNHNAKASETKRRPWQEQVKV